jgi:hypothetical protein
MEKLYRIEELETSGWTLVEHDDIGLTQEHAKNRYAELLNEGFSPERLRIVREK